MSEYQKKLDEICICKKYDDLKQENYKLKLAIKLLQKKLKLYLENNKIRAILPIGNSDMNSLNQAELELLEEVLINEM